MKSIIATLFVGFFLALGVGCFSSLEFAQQDRSTSRMSRLEIEQKREEWFYGHRAYPHKHIPAGARLKALKELGRMLKAQREARKRQAETQPSGTPASSTTPLPAQWIQVGPEPASFWDSASVGGSSGRATSVVVDPRNSQVIYLGTAGGGVWKTTDGGKTWVPLTDNQPSLAIGSLALDPSNPDIIYAGTGEENFSIDSYYGAGILKSIDAGATWTVLSGPFASRGQVGGVAVDPTNGQVVLAAYGSAVLRSSDGGGSWTSVLPGVGTAVLFDPSGTNAYAALGAVYGEVANGIYRSSDAGQTWTKVLGPGTSFLASTSIGRIGLALDPANPQTLYASIANPAGSSQGDALGVFKTTDRGQTWTQLTTPPSCCWWYGTPIAVDPANPSVLFTGEGDVSRSLDGGVTWTDVGGYSGGGANGISLHPDQHAFAFSADGSTLYVANDGGAYSTTDLNVTSIPNWNDLNVTLATINFYPGLSISPSNPGLAFAGTQDTGSLRYTGSLPWDAVACGDGSYTAMDSTSLANVYINCVTGAIIYKSTSNGDPGTFAEVDSGIPSSEQGFGTPLVLDPSHQNTLYFGGTHYVYQTTDGATSWTKLSASFTASVTTIAVAPTDSNTVYVGTGDSHVQVTTDAADGVGAVWKDVTAGLPNRSVTRIAVDPGKAATAYVTLSGFSGRMNPSGHVFKTTDSGTTWTDISGNLPDIPVNAMVIDPDLPTTLYIGTDIGVFYSADNGTAWYPLMDGLPNVVVHDLVLQRASRTLRATTHGRSAWDLALPSPLAPVVSLSPSALDFGLQPLGSTSASQTVTLTDAGNSTLTISAISATGGFAVSNDCGTILAANTSCTISVTFSPTKAGSQSGTLTVTDDAAGSPQSVALAGTGVPPSITVTPTSLDFGGHDVGAISNARNITLLNTGSVALAITGIITNLKAFSETNTCGTSLAAGQSCTIGVTFAPTSAGTIAGTLTVNDDAANSPQTVPLLGAGQDFTLSSASGSSSVTQGQSATYNLSISPAGGFNQLISLGCTGAPGKSTCAVSPSSVTLDGTNPQNVKITVTTTAPSLAPPGPRGGPPAPGNFVVINGLVALLLMAALTLLFKRRRSVPLLAGAVMLVAMTLSCGGGGGGGGSMPSNPGTPAGNYTLTITGTSGSLSHQTTMTLTVQ